MKQTKMNTNHIYKQLFIMSNSSKKSKEMYFDGKKIAKKVSGIL